MKEELIISGRHLPNIDPHLHVWHWPIALYLFLGGLAAGIIFFSSLFTLLKKDKLMPATMKYATMVVPVALSVGLLALFYDLTHKLYVWRLYTTIRITSPMSWGAWVLLAITPLSMVWVFSYFTDVFPKWDWKYDFIKKLEKLAKEYRYYIAMILLPLSVILGIYTGILLSAFNARPLWNNAILGPLFLTSGLSTGAATIILFAKSHYERNLFSKIDLVLIGIELFLITHMIMGYYAAGEVQLDSISVLMGGEFTVTFFVFVILMGLIFPAFIELIELLGFRVPVIVPAILILVGGYIFRMVMLDAGQMTRYLY